MNRVKLAKQIHQTAKDKGWWDEERNHDEMFMLIITELAEAIEADRKEGWMTVQEFNSYSDSSRTPEDFRKYIKDTVEDELADAYIRCLDYLYYKRGETMSEGSYNVVFQGENFAASVFQVCKTVTSRRIVDAVVEIEALCARYGVDLEWHVSQKMAYNAQREYKHGGKKY